MSQAFTGYGSKLEYSADQVNYTRVGQLQRISPSGSKQKIIDQTNLRTPDNFTRSKAVQVDGGEVDFAGVYSGDPTQLTLGQYHGSLTLLFFRLTLTDGTIYNFSGYVSQFNPGQAIYNKFIPFTGKLRIVGKGLFN